MELGDHYFAAASHVKGLFQKVNELRLDMDGESPYINSGVLMMNLELLRREQREADVFAFIESHKNALLLAGSGRDQQPVRPPDSAPGSLSI